MKILVLGATGMAGHTISIFLKEIGHEITALSRRKFTYCNSIIGDVSDFNNLNIIIKQGDYDAVINAIGILNQDAEDNKSMSVLLNSYLPHYLSDITKNMKTKIIHLSTDCVFSGEKGGYTEKCFTDGQTFYDRSKALGEIVNDKDLTFRNSIIGPDLSKDGIGLFNWFMNQNSKIQGFTNVIWTGVTTLVLAKAIDQALRENITGLYHLVNNQAISKYNLLKLFNKHMKSEPVEILKNDAPNINKALINNRRDFSFFVPDYEEMVVDMKMWINNHKELYPHYFEGGDKFEYIEIDDYSRNPA